MLEYFHSKYRGCSRFAPWDRIYIKREKSAALAAVRCRYYFRGIGQPWGQWLKLGSSGANEKPKSERD
jgi:hypothetical protein